MPPKRRFDLRQTRKWTVLLREPRRCSAQQNRWALWARSLAARHLRLAQRRDLLDLVFAHPRSLVRVLRERWLVTSRRVQPRIGLAIHAILKLTINQQQRSSVNHTGAQTTFVGIQNATFLNPTRFLNTAGLSSRELPARSLPAAPNLSKAQTPGEAFEDIPSPNSEGFVLNAGVPLTLVFRRVQEIQKLTHSRLVEAVLDQREHSISRRITERSRRTETMVTNVSTLTRPQTVNTETETMPSQSMKLAPLAKLTPAAVKVFERSMTMAPATATVETTFSQKENTLLPDLNLEQITDQVVRRLDHRVVAMRERMGRI